MRKKISISLPEHIFRLAERRSRLTGGTKNFSSYICELIRKEFTETELEKELREVSKPLATGRWKIADFNTTCQYCKKLITKGDRIYETTLGYPDNKKNWVHEDCCRKE